jgi:hypothetical protein
VLEDPTADLVIRIGWQILEDDYRIEQKNHGSGQEALQHAISRYNTGDTRHLGRVLAAVRSLPSDRRSPTGVL